jgi:hypothetical protein
MLSEEFSIAGAAQQSRAEQSQAEQSQAANTVPAVEPTQGAGQSRANHSPQAVAFMDNPLLAKIFKNDRFLRVSQEHNINNSLIGKSLVELYGGNEDHSQGKQHYIAFLSNDPEGDLVYFLDENHNDTEAERAKILLDCLKDHSYNPTTREATIHESNIVLNIWEWAGYNDCTQIPGLKDKMMFKKNDSGVYLTFGMRVNPCDTPFDQFEFDDPEWDGVEFKIPIEDREWLFVERD